jgi:hypothetical protein
MKRGCKTACSDREVRSAMAANIEPTFSAFHIGSANNHKQIRRRNVRKIKK